MTEPITATPSVPPSSRVVSLTADPTPALAVGSAPMMASVAGPMVRARPAAISVIEAMTGPQYAESTLRVAATANPALMISSPPATTILVPIRFMTAIAAGDTAPVTTANGRVATPALSGSYPWTSWKYWVIRNMNPNSPKKASAIAPLAAENLALVNSRTSSIGSGRRAWQRANQARIAADPANPPSVADDAQPCVGASITVQTSSPTPATDNSAPTGSNRPASSSRDSGSSQAPATRAMA